MSLYFVIESRDLLLSTYNMGVKGIVIFKINLIIATIKFLHAGDVKLTYPIWPTSKVSCSSFTHPIIFYHRTTCILQRQRTLIWQHVHKFVQLSGSFRVPRCSLKYIPICFSIPPVMLQLFNSFWHYVTTKQTLDEIAFSPPNKIN